MPHRRCGEHVPWHGSDQRIPVERRIRGTGSNWIALWLLGVVLMVTMIRTVAEGRLLSASSQGVIVIAYWINLSRVGIELRGDRLRLRSWVRGVCLDVPNASRTGISIGGNLIVRVDGRRRLVLRSISTFDPLKRKMPDAVVEALELAGVDVRGIRPAV